MLCLLGACGDVKVESQQGDCLPNQSFPCTCTSGSTGAQLCQADKTLGPCVCADDDAGPSDAQPDDGTPDIGAELPPATASLHVGWEFADGFTCLSNGVEMVRVELEANGEQTVPCDHTVQVGGSPTVGVIFEGLEPSAELDIKAYGLDSSGTAVREAAFDDFLTPFPGDTLSTTLTLACTPDTCVCESQDSSACHDGDVYWFDSCGAVEDLRTDCVDPEFCWDGACVVDPWPVGDKPIMAECQLNGDCASGYCYDEPFLQDFKFCSVDCDGADPCSEIVGPGGEQLYQCLNFAGSLASDYGLTVTHLCALRCATVEDCKALSPKYDACGNSSFGTEWDGKTVGVKTCLITSKID